MKTGIIDVGGGFRDIYGAGVLDVCMARGIHFDYCIGISAGSANLASYLAQQPGRSYTFYMEYVFRKEYASLDNWLKTRNYVDLDYIYGTLSNSDGENPVDFEAMKQNAAEFYVGACNALTGEPIYFDKSYLSQDHYDIFKASCALPVFCKPYMIGDIPCLDGGISDPIPVDKALSDGCDRVVLILTRPVDQPRQAKKDRMIADLLSRSYPKAGECMRTRYRTYNDGVARALALQAQGKVLVVAPDDICGLSTLTKDREKLQRMYDKGVRDAERVCAFLKG
ncbi:MAG: patatin family protein [Candidatus Ventricola sp.]